MSLTPCGTEQDLVQPTVDFFGSPEMSSEPVERSLASLERSWQSPSPWHLERQVTPKGALAAPAFDVIEPGLELRVAVGSPVKVCGGDLVGAEFIE
jgi:hypothetical protein